MNHLPCYLDTSKLTPAHSLQSHPLCYRVVCQTHELGPHWCMVRICMPPDASHSKAISAAASAGSVGTDGKSSEEVAAWNAGLAAEAALNGLLQAARTGVVAQVCVCCECGCAAVRVCHNK